MDISAKYPFPPEYVDIFNSKMHYIEDGDADPIVFLHGVPTWSYLWRNIIPSVAEYGRCIAPDLIGFGLSDKPEIDYTVFDHIKYFDAFMESLALCNVTLVMHGWGSVIGLDYAVRHPDNVKGIVMYEAHLRTPHGRAELSLPVQEIAGLLRDPKQAKDIILNSNYYINKVLPSGVLRKLTDEELEAYQQPFSKPGSALPIWQYLNDLPKGDEEGPVVELIERYSKALCQSEIPKLLFYAVPGFITTIETVKWAKEHFPNLTLIEIDDALHYAQESNPQFFADELIQWLKQR